MKKVIFIAIVIILVGLIIACPFLYFLFGPRLDQNQLDTVLILMIIASCSALYCFVVGEITGNNSQMDKLWSLLPIAYVWVIAGKGGMSPRLVIMAIITTLWGIRLTFNFARKGAYKLRFWEGKEDYRWEIVRGNKLLKPHWKWVLFNLFFICIYQNIVVLFTCLPAVIVMSSTVELGWVDYLATGFALFFLIFETVADEQQYDFQTVKWRMLGEGKRLEELPEPFRKGFNTTGLWGVSRHPNYLGEQGFWVFFYVFTIGGGIGVFNYSAIGALLLITLFLGSSTLTEGISSSKYPEYSEYMSKVSRYFPWRKYDN